jgi:hypothetical protein
MVVNFILSYVTVQQKQIVKRIEMVNNSTNINKANNHFSPSLTEDKIKRKHDSWKSKDRHNKVVVLNRLLSS